MLVLRRMVLISAESLATVRGKMLPTLHMLPSRYEMAPPQVPVPDTSHRCLPQLEMTIKRTRHIRHLPLLPRPASLAEDTVTKIDRRSHMTVSVRC